MTNDDDVHAGADLWMRTREYVEKVGTILNEGKQLPQAKFDTSCVGVYDRQWVEGNAAAHNTK